MDYSTGVSPSKMLDMFEEYLTNEFALEDEATEIAAEKGPAARNSAWEKEENDMCGVVKHFAGMLGTLPVQELLELTTAMMHTLPSEDCYPALVEKMMTEVAFATKQRIIMALVSASPQETRASILHQMLTSINPQSKLKVLMAMVHMLPPDEQIRVLTPVLKKLPTAARRLSTQTLNMKEVNDVVKTAVQNMNQQQRQQFISYHFGLLLHQEQEVLLGMILQMIPVNERRKHLSALILQEDIGDRLDLLMRTIEKLSQEEKVRRCSSAQLSHIYNY
jgi:hypothetical protein